jgi:hypothetical protein
VGVVAGGPVSERVIFALFLAVLTLIIAILVTQ